MKRSWLVCLGYAVLAFPALAPSAHTSDYVQITATHPLEPLSALEIKAVYEIVKARFTNDPTCRINCVPMSVLSEPPKPTVLAWKTGDLFPRVAHVETYTTKDNWASGEVGDPRADCRGRAARIDRHRK